MTEAPPIQARIMLVTPKIAEALLARNTHNRSLVEARVQQYAADIRNGDWKVNGEAIKIADTGQILDGQHRLVAITEADAAITTLVITGLPLDAQETMDQNRARSFADVLKLRGESDYNNLGAAVRMVGLYERDGIPFSAGRSPLTVQQMLRVLDRNPEIRDSVKFAERFKGRFKGPRWVTISMLAGMHYLFSIADQADADYFITKLVIGEGEDPLSPPCVLRERLIREHATARGLHARVKMAFFVKAWNAYRRGERARLVVDASTDQFPAIDGLADRRPTTEASGRVEASRRGGRSSLPSPRRGRSQADDEVARAALEAAA